MHRELTIVFEDASDKDAVLMNLDALASRIRQYGVLNADGMRLMVNGEQIGEVSVTEFADDEEETQAEAA